MERMGSVVRPMSPPNRVFAVLFVCMGNICRSPMLMAILQKMAEKRHVGDRVHIDSCALTSWYVGKPTDPRMVKAAIGMELTLDHCARLLREEDFASSDLILAVDNEVLEQLKQMAKEHGYKGIIALATAYSTRFPNQEISDPYYGGPDGFKRTIEIAEDCCKGILDFLIHEKL